VPPYETPPAHRESALGTAKHRDAPCTAAPFARLAGAWERCERAPMEGTRRARRERHRGRQRLILHIKQ
jgi:hypothetical protein